MTDRSIPFIPDSAPFTPEQRSWLNGLLTGLFSGSQPAANAAAASAPAGPPLHILFGSQTGNAEALARQAAKSARTAGLEVTLVGLGDFDLAGLAAIQNLLLITSTYGEGDPPDNARPFHDFLLGDSAPRLPDLRYAVLGLGDRNYADFNACAIRLDERLAALGASRLRDGLWCDVDFEEAAAAFVATVINQLAGPADSAVRVPTPIAGPPTEGPVWSRKNPFPARLLANHNLNASTSAKETRHVVFSLEGSGLDYTPGDALGVRPENCPTLVREILAAAGLDPALPTPLPDRSEGPLKAALTRHYDLNRLTRPFLEACIHHATTPPPAALRDDPAAMDRYLEGRQVLDPLADFRPVFPGPEAFIAPLRTLQPRLYSIASSLRAHPGEVHLTVGLVRWEAAGKPRRGLCSGFLAALAPGATAGVHLHRNPAFKLPEDPGRPIIMIGPGTGIAPFRAFFQERAATGAPGRNWLFFGDRTAADDFLYRDELRGWLASGLLTRLDTAFSRDQERKIYVQDRMREAADTLRDWLAEGAVLYVCGDAARMARDVETALLEILADGRPETAAERLDHLRKNKQYLRDIY
ncbi:MAG: sulfite reductase subunit alpha [Puniceicoccaceae bacterium]|nr:MAG: sulfite reductase subunit alpha [Puniceicoccaceae bacterium]